MASTLFLKHDGVYISIVVETLIGRKLLPVFLNDCVIISLVLNFGDKPLKNDLLFDDPSIPDEFKAFIPKFKMNIVDVQYLQLEDIERFSSDFKVLADHFIRTRLLREKNIPYVPHRKEIVHLEEFLQLITALTNDSKYMRDAFDWLKEEGTVDTTISHVINFMDSMRAKGRYVALSEAFSVLKVKEDVIERCFQSKRFQDFVSTLRM